MGLAAEGLAAPFLFGMTQGIEKEREIVKRISKPEGKPVLQNDRYSLYGVENPDGLAITGVVRRVAEGLDEVFIPQTIGGLPVVSLDLSWCFDPGHPARINLLRFPDSLVHLPPAALRHVDRAELIPTGKASFVAVNDCLLTADRRTLVDVLDRTSRVHDVPQGVQVIGCAAGLDSGAERICLPESLTEIGDRAFSNMPRLRSVVLPKGVRRVGRFAFADSALTAAILPRGLREIGGCAFSGSNLLEVTLPEELEHMGNGAFSWCSDLRIVHFPRSLRRISEGAFRRCDALRRAELPQGLQELGDGAFNGCEVLEEINLPDSLRMLGETALAGCVNLKRILISDAHPCFRLEAGALLTRDGLSLLRMADMGAETVQVPPTVLRMNRGVFAGMRRLRQVTLPEGLEEISEELLRGCDCLEEIRIPRSVRRIGPWAFAHCGALRTLTLPDGVMEIGSGALLGCRSLKELRLSVGLTALPENLLYGCDALKRLILPMQGPIDLPLTDWGISSPATLFVSRGSPLHAQLEADAAQHPGVRLELIN